MRKSRTVGKKKEYGFWSSREFAETMSSRDAEERMKTFHMKHDEDMNFNCRKCNKRISAHNKDWHDGMCDDCFKRKYFSQQLMDDYLRW